MEWCGETSCLSFLGGEVEGSKDDALIGCEVHELGQESHFDQIGSIHVHRPYLAHQLLKFGPGSAVGERLFVRQGQAH